MKPVWRAGLAAVLMAAAGPALAGSVAGVNAAIDRLLGNSKQYQTAITAFQQAVAAGDREDVAAFIRYPIRIETGGRKIEIRSSAAFVKHYDAIMTADIVGAIEKQNYAELFVNDRGVMFGKGEAWMNGICLDGSCRHFVVKVIALQHGPTD